jgi:hypothetical protein
LEGQNSRLGDEIEDMEAQLETVQAAIQKNTPAAQPGLQPSKAVQPPQNPGEIVDLLRTAYIALQSSQLPTVTSVSSSALQAVLAEVQQSVPVPAESGPTSTDQNSAADPQSAQSSAPRPRWGDDADSMADVGEDQDAFEDDAAVEPFEEGAGEPPYPDEDSADYIAPGPRRAARSSTRVLQAISKSKLSSKLLPQGPASSSSHRGPGHSFAALRAQQKASAESSGGDG